MQKEVKKPSEQVLYMGRWVDKKSFRAYVYNEKTEKLANSYEEYEELVTSGLWFTEKPDASSKKGKLKNGNTDGQAICK
jgi:hypothetical protein